MIRTADRGGQAGAGRGRRRRSSPSTTSAATTPCWSSSAARRDRPRRAGRDHHRRVGRQGPEVAGRRSTSSGAASLSRAAPAPRPPTRPAGASRCSRRSGSRTPTPTWCCPPCSRKYGLTAATRRSPPSWRRGRSGARAPTTRSSPPASTGRWPRSQAKVLDALRLGAHQLLVDAGARPRRDQHHRRPGAAPGRPGRRRVRQRRAAQGRRARPRRVGRAARTRPATDPAATPRSPQPPALGRRGADRGAVGARRARRAARRRQRAAAGHPGRAARARPTRRRAAGASRRRYSPYGVVLEGGDPGAMPAVAEGRAGVQDEGSQLVAAGPGRGPGRRPRRALARPLRRPGRQGRAAGGAGRRAGRAAAWPTSGSRTGPGWCAAPLRGADGVLGVVTADGTAAAVAGRARSTGCSSTRRAPGSARCAGGPRRAGAASPTDLRDAGAAPARAGRRGPRPASGPAAWCSTRPARRCSPRPRAWSASVLAARGTTPSSRTPRPLLPGVPDCAGPLPGTVQLWPHRHGTDAMFGALLRRGSGDGLACFRAIVGRQVGSGTLDAYDGGRRVHRRSGSQLEPIDGAPWSAFALGEPRPRRRSTPGPVSIRRPAS